ncbi:hypothetical protein DSECCO2_583780 [anaerobic digester metagenome]
MCGSVVAAEISSGNREVTVTSAVPSTILSGVPALITADPGASAVKYPVSFTVPTDSLLHAQENTIPEIAEPDTSYAVAIHRCMLPGVASAVAGVTSIWETSGIPADPVAFDGRSVPNAAAGTVPSTRINSMAITHSCNLPVRLQLSSMSDQSFHSVGVGGNLHKTGDRVAFICVESLNPMCYDLITHYKKILNLRGVNEGQLT